nr:acyl-CoA thioesterase [Lachnospiraceae bacterium]
MEPYKHIVQYYETDRMGVTHHSNYIRWMEEARVDFLRQIGWGYDKLEAAGVLSPVTAVECRYRASTTFSDEVTVRVTVREFNGVVLKLQYRMTGPEGRTVFEGVSEHCFLNNKGRIVRLKKEQPEFYEVLTSFVREEP